MVQDALAAGRMRLIEVFRETDKDGDGALSCDELFRLVSVMGEWEWDRLMTGGSSEEQGDR